MIKPKQRGGARTGAGKKKIPDAQEITLKVPAPLVPEIKKYVQGEVKKYMTGIINYDTRK